MLRLLSAPLVPLTLTSSLRREFSDNLRELFGAVHGARSRVVNSLLRILRLAGEIERETHVFAVDILVGTVGFRVDGDRLAFDHVERQDRA